MYVTICLFTFAHNVWKKVSKAKKCCLLCLNANSTALYCTALHTLCYCCFMVAGILFLFLFNPLPRVCCYCCCFCYYCWFVYLPHPLSSVEYVFVQWLRLTGLSMSSSHHFHFVCFLMSNKMKNKIYYGAWKTCHGVWCGNGIVYVYMCLCFYFSSPFLGVCVFFFLIGLMFWNKTLQKP